MIVPGSNLLRIAGKMIRFQRVQWRAWTGRTENHLGQWVSEYGPPVTIRGSWQPVSRERFARQGLEFARKYVNFYTSHPVRGVETNRGADLLDYRGWRYEVVNVEPWGAEDGWSHILAVRVGEIPND